jgi:GxxExxY protein
MVMKAPTIDDSNLTAGESSSLMRRVGADLTAENAEKAQRTQRVDENVIGEQVLGLAVKVHRTVGPGLLESAYEACFAYELTKAGLPFERQLLLPLYYDGVVIESGYRLDLLVARKVVIEIKAVDKLIDVHRAQLLGYLKLGGFRLGYLLNFNVAMLRNGIVRLANGL